MMNCSDKIKKVHGKMVLTLFFLIGSAMLLHSQSNQSGGFVDIVELNGGTELWGRVISYDPESELILELASGATIHINHQQIKRIYQKASFRKEKKLYEFSEKGMYCSFDAGLLFGTEVRTRSGSDWFSTGTEGVASWSISASGGHQYNRYFGAGIGVGVDNHTPGYIPAIVPIFGEVRGYLVARKMSPYYNVRFGYGWSPGDGGDFGFTSARGGWMANPSIGMRWGGSSGVNFTTRLGIVLQDAAYEDFSTDVRSTYEVLYKRWSLTVGIVF